MHILTVYHYSIVSQVFETVHLVAAPLLHYNNLAYKIRIDKYNMLIIKCILTNIIFF